LGLADRALATGLRLPSQACSQLSQTPTQIVVKSAAVLRGIYYFRNKKNHNMQGTKATNIDEYISEFPGDIQKKLRDLRAAIKKAAPKAEEKISYAMPTFAQHGNLVHFAAYKNHIGFYPAPTAIEAFKKELSAYEGSKGTVQFPLDKPIPLGLITKMVKFRLAQNLEKAATKKKKK
jgi:uncharacterized protein YdhG (YjbR/CyaY superfamily)